MAGSARLIVFLAMNAAVWLLMVAILVLVPDQLAAWMPLEVARGVGWAVACSAWVLTVERQWQTRFRPLPRALLQLLLWVAAAVVAVAISDSARLTVTVGRTF
jgi:hypothetical protein